MFDWTPACAARLRSATREYGNQADIAQKSGVPIATLQRILKGTTNPGLERLQAIVDAIEVPIEAIVGDADQGGAFVEVPIADIHVAAGSGRFALDEATIGSWPFPRAWIEANWPRTKLRVVYVSGDSQEPVLRDGDAVLVDVSPTVGSDGMHVIRLDDALLIKRLQVEGAQFRLKSHNPAYDDIVVDMRADQDRFAIIGRAVAAVKAL